MPLPPDVILRLRNTSVRELVRALERDGFAYQRRRSSGRLYRHSDGRRVVVHYHRANDTFPIGTLRNILNGTRWAQTDLERLGLL